MRIRLLILAAIIALLGFAPAPLPRKERMRDDPTDVEGTWEFLVYDMNGKPYEPGKTESEIEMKKDQFTFVSRRGTSRTAYTMRLDPAAAPASFTWSMQGRVMFVGSYRLQKDQITMIFRYGNGVEQRPTDFNGVSEYHYVLRRVRR